MAGIPAKKIYTWTKIISEHTKNGQPREALRCYKQMREEGIIPNNYTFVAALKACGIISDLQAAKEIHGHARKSCHGMHIFLANTLIHVYAKCGRMADAQLTFEHMKHRDTVSWNAIIMGYVHMNMGDSALHLYARMRNQGFPSPDAWTYVAVLKACGSLAAAAQEAGTRVENEDPKASCLEQGRAIHSELAKREFCSDVYIGGSLIDMYIKCGSIEDACHVFDRMTYRDVVAWTAMISGYAQFGMGNSALELYAQMQQEGLAPDAHTFVAALKACGSLVAQEAGKGVESKLWRTSFLEKGKSLHAQITKRALEDNVFVATTLVDMYAKCGSIEDARHVFEKMKLPNVVSWNAMIIGYAQMEMGDRALELFARMQDEGFTPNARTYIGALKAYGSLAAQQECKELGLGFLKTSFLEQGKAIHDELRTRGLESEISVANTLIDMYVKCRSIDDAHQVFKKMKHPDLVSWNAMIIGYAEMAMGDLALKLYDRMQEEGFVPDVCTFVAALKACGSLASLETGKEIHDQINRVGLLGQLLIATSLIDMYGKCGSMIDAQQCFDSLIFRDSVTWTALIAGYSGQGDGECLFDLYERMHEEGIKPDGITFVSVLTFCSHNGLMDKGQMYFQEMLLEYAIFPSYNHYFCMVDLLGRAGQLDEAVAILKKMQFRPNLMTCITILSACRKWNNVETGRNAFECAVMLEDKYAAAYVLMTNIYVSTGMLKESAKIQEMRIKVRAWMVPAKCTWTDSAGIVHTFPMRDSKHPQSKEISAKLREICMREREEKDRPDLGIASLHVLDAEKENLLCGHHEMLAIACALINTLPGTPIRIVKNPEISVDCHKASGLISKMEQRTIICRDASRFHIFKDGKCSCGDFW